MKRVVIVLALLLAISMVSAETINIQELFESDERVLEIEQDSTRKSYFYDGHKLVADKSHAGINYHFQDRLGTEMGGKNLPFGQELIDSKEKFEFTGKELDDESGLNYFGARYYDSTLGKFTSTDPIKENHAYNYAKNSPLTYIDPNGMDETTPEQEKPIFLWITLDPIADHNGAFEKEKLHSSVYEHYNVIERVIREGGPNFFEIIRETAREHGKIAAGGHGFHGSWYGFFVYPIIKQVNFGENFEIESTDLDYTRSHVLIPDAIDQGLFGLQDSFEEGAVWFGVSCSNGAPSEHWKYRRNFQEVLTLALGITTHAYTEDGSMDIYYNQNKGKLEFATKIYLSVMPVFATYENGEIVSLRRDPSLERKWEGYDRERLLSEAQSYRDQFEFSDFGTSYNPTPTRTLSPFELISQMFP